MIDRLMSWINPLRVRENWHRNPLVSRAMCALGRHDYEPLTVSVERKQTQVDMVCFYCLHKKQARLTETTFTY